MQDSPNQMASFVTHVSVSAPDGSSAHVDPIALHVAVQLPPAGDFSHSSPVSPHQVSTGGGAAGEGGGSGGSGGGGGSGWQGQNRW